MDNRDLETRQRLIEVAARLFAERGFSKVTVREICRSARANVAAINYHFGGKQGLYDDIVRSAITTMHRTTEAIQQAGEGKPADEQLRIFVRIFLTRVVQARDGWIHQLMARELNDPTPALDLVVTQVVRPRMAYLASVIAVLIGCRPNDSRVERSVMSVQAQCLILLNDKIANRLHPFAITNKRLTNSRAHHDVFAGWNQGAEVIRLSVVGPQLRHASPGRTGSAPKHEQPANAMAPARRARPHPAPPAPRRSSTQTSRPKFRVSAIPVRASSAVTWQHVKSPSQPRCLSALVCRRDK